MNDPGASGAVLSPTQETGSKSGLCILNQDVIIFWGNSKVLRATVRTLEEEKYEDVLVNVMSGIPAVQKTCSQ